MFSPFFTTKPTGEGTGQGLSSSHDIIVKQYGGSIDVDTQPGEFTEIRVILPRSAVLSKASRLVWLLDVRYWPKEDTPICIADVCF